jgi:hypothetical protein
MGRDQEDSEVSRSDNDRRTFLENSRLTSYCLGIVATDASVL